MRISRLVVVQLLLLVLLICCAAENYDDDYDDDDGISELLQKEREMKEDKAKCSVVDLDAKKEKLRAQIIDLFSANEHQSSQLQTVIDKVFKDIATLQQAQSQTTEPAAGTITTEPPNAKSCGPQMECVAIWMCRNNTLDNYGAHQIVARSDECGINEVCCRTADKLLTTPSPEHMEQMPDCGYRNASGSQPGANESSFGEFPWMVALIVIEDVKLSIERNIGGGSLLAPNVVMTAAHKLVNCSLDNLVARAGEWDGQNKREIYAYQDLYVQQSIVPPQDYNNIALLILKGSFRPSPHIAPICLPRPSATFDLAQCIVTGWGKTSGDNPELPKILKKITVSIVPRAECLRKLRSVVPAFRLLQSQICAGGEKGVDACDGDGGSPLVCPIKGSSNRYYQAGIVSLGYGCGRENVPAVYTNVARLMPWVSGELNRLGIDSKYYTANASE